ncbi:MAG TPA: MFS transporter, partial [Gammaproteobacteria bacterium]|nr:MFS transporter [Gammaproteobacteria bacterium]
MPRNGSGGLARGLFPHLAGANRGVLALSAARLGDAVGNSILFIVIPLYVARLPAPRLPFPETIRAGVLISAFGMVAAGAQPLAAFLSDRSDRRKPFIMAGLLVMALSTLGFVFAGRFVDLLALRASQGLGLAITLPASLAILARHSEMGTRGGSM